MIVRDRKYETEAIRRRLTTAAVGEEITYAELSQIAGSEVHPGLSALTSARRIVLSEDRIAFESVRGVGLRRLGDEELATVSSERDVRKSRRHAHRALKKLACVNDFASMSGGAQLAHTIRASFFSAVFDMAKKNRLESIASAAAGRSSQLPVKETLQAFLGGK